MKKNDVLLDRDLTFHELSGCLDKMYHLLDSLYNVSACSTCLDKHLHDRLQRLIGKLEVYRDSLDDFSYDV